MTTCLRTQWASLSVVLLWSMVPTISCYRPNITSGGLECAEGGTPCPDDFHCASNRRCYKGDGGPACESPPPTPSCTADPAAGQICNPSCDKGCGCGFCGVSNGATTCLTVAAGSANVGDLCDPTQPAPCQKGLYCKPECNSTDPKFGRCYKFCDVASDCQICTGDGACQTTTCTVSATSVSSAGQSFSFQLCSQPAQNCLPVGATSGCLTTDSALACYSQSDLAYCYCKGIIQPNSTTATCAFLGDCIPGYSCVNLGGGSTSNVCLPTCRASTDCTAPATCRFLPGDHIFGSCN
jgi:hypothetical protein